MYCTQTRTHIYTCNISAAEQKKLLDRLENAHQRAVDHALKLKQTGKQNEAVQAMKAVRQYQKLIADVKARYLFIFLMIF